MHNLLDIIQRQLVVGINCTPDAGVVSCLFEPDSHTICSSDMSEIIISNFHKCSRIEGNWNNVPRHWILCE